MKVTENTISYGVAECGHAGQIFRTGKCANCYIADLERPSKDYDLLLNVAARIRNAFEYGPGESDLDNEQPIHISVTLREWRELNFALNRLRREQLSGDNRQ